MQSMEHVCDFDGKHEMVCRVVLIFVCNNGFDNIFRFDDNEPMNQNKINVDSVGAMAAKTKN